MREEKKKRTCTAFVLFFWLHDLLSVKCSLSLDNAKRNDFQNVPPRYRTYHAGIISLERETVIQTLCSPHTSLLFCSAAARES